MSPALMTAFITGLSFACIILFDKVRKQRLELDHFNYRMNTDDERITYLEYKMSILERELNEERESRWLDRENYVRIPTHHSDL